MSKKMLIDASHPEETRVVVVDGTKVVELDYESENKRQLRGNVYLARVTRVEPSLQAAFVEFGGNRHGFLAFSEIHPDYYQIPHEDRQAIIDAEVAESLEDEKAAESALQKTRKNKRADADEADAEEIADSDDEDEDDEANSESDLDSEDEAEAEEIVDAADKEDEEEQEQMLGARRKRISKRRYKIQEVIKRGQILLIQAVKEERGNKGAAMTTYLSLAGRYCVLMPNTPRGGGISRKIANGSDRKRLKTIMSDLSVPQGMGVIVRTAGAKRTKPEIKRDFDYLSRLWDTIRNTTMESIAPALIHEEGDLVKRSIRDLYGKDIDSVLVQGDEAYRLAKDFIKMLMPSHAKNVQPYKDDIPLFLRYQVEQQIEACLEPVAQLKSGGYLVIHPTEALVSVDVNSGRSTKERNVERTALKTNLEAADEVARQMRLRDLAGLVVIDFIDMDENRNNRAVEKRMREALSKDRARVQMGKISQFGLMEISRQRRRRSLLEGSTASCEHCGGVGRKRSIESSALRAIRAAEEEGIRNRSRRIRLKVSADVAFYLINEKRDLLNRVDQQSEMFTEVVAEKTFIRPHFEIERVETNKDVGADPLEEIFKENRKAQKSRNAENEKSRRNRKPKKEEGDESEEETTNAEADGSEEGQRPNKRKRRRGRRGGRNRRPDNRNKDENSDSENTDAKAENADADVKPDGENQTDAKPKRSRSRRRPAAKKADTSETATETVDAKSDEDATAKPKRGRRKAKTDPVEDAPKAEEEKPKRKRAPARKKAEVKDDAPAKTEDVKPKKKPTRAKKKPTKDDAEAPAAKPAKAVKPKKEKAVAVKPEEKPVVEKPAKKEAEAKKPKKKGWWQKSNPFN